MSGQGPGLVPRRRAEGRTGWRQIRLKYTVGRPVAGDWGDEPRGDDTDTPCVRVADFDYARGGLKTPIPTVRSFDAIRRQPRELRHGDLLLEKSGGGDQQPVGRVVMVDREPERPTVSSNFIARLRPRLGFDSRYLCYLHRAIYASGAVNFAVRQTTGIQNLDLEQYLATTAPVPSLEEQRDIADFLDTETGIVDELLRLKRDLLSRLPERVAAVMHEAITSLPRNARLAYVVDWRSGGTPPKEEAEHWRGDLPWASTKDIPQDHLTATVDHITEEAAAAYSCTVPPGSLLIATRGMALAKRLPLAVTTRRTAFNQDLKALVPNPRVDPAYLRVVLRGLESEILANVVEAAHGTRRLETQRLKALHVPMPEPRTQRVIVERVRAVEKQNNAVASRLERQISLLVKRRETLITAAVTGQLDPNSYRPSALTT